MKTKMKTLLETLAASTDFIESLHELRQTPPFHYTDIQWKTLSALLKILPIAAAQLTLAFKEKNEVDFIEITQAALQALGSFDAPTDLALSLDYQIKHILVDEFQDTSISQFRLFELLTAGWENNDGRTLFLVGDPMQSIYRFRQAEVGLFLRARHEGIGQLQLKSLTLSTNFRSSKAIIDWINTHCEAMFPTNEDISDGAVTYTNALASHHQTKNTNVKLHALIDADETLEAQEVIHIIKKHRKDYPNDTIAILVKARSHLFEILPMLRANNLPYQAVEIDKLVSRPIIQDLLALTKALLHPADRTAWFSILRAPWCGLTLKDLQIISQSKSDSTILKNIQNKKVFEALSNDGKKRLASIQNIILYALNNRRRKPLREFIYNVWINLRAPACYDHFADLMDAENYFQLLEQLDSGGDIKDFSPIKEKLDKLYASPDINASEKLQVMTIHKAKGLEFDTVIIPGLHRSTPTNDPQLLLWAERPRTHKENDLILAPIKAAHESGDPIYDYLAHENKKKSTFEDLRLLYVAMTRAKNHLHLLGTAFTTEDGEALKNPISSGFLSYLWPLIQKDFFERLHAKQSTHIQNIKLHNVAVEGIRRLSKQTDVISNLELSDNNEPVILDEKFIKANYHTVVGTVTHQILQQISDEGIQTWHADRINQYKSSWKSLLLQLGILPQEIEAAVTQVIVATKNTLTDEKGRWILGKHTQAQSEYRLTLANGKQIIIDRTFIDEANTRWIIDYKTTDEIISDNDVFLATAKNAHRQQLETYADALKHFGNEKIRAALYYPLQKLWIEYSVRYD